MLDARALQYAIFISVIIALSSGLFIQVAFLQNWHLTENLNQQKRLQYLQVGITQLLYKECSQIDCDWNDSEITNNHSLLLHKGQWGCYDIGLVSLIFQQPGKFDTLNSAFFIGKNAKMDFPDALYLSEQNRPLILAGNTSINGAAFLPKAGVRRGTIEGQPFIRPKLINGPKKISGPFLPEINKERLTYWQTQWNRGLLSGTKLDEDIEHSFNKTTRFYNGNNISLNNINLKGNIIVCATHQITIGASANIEDVLLIAPNIVVKSGFKGALQAVAWNKLIVEQNTELEYPSAVGIIKTNTTDSLTQLIINNRSRIDGLVFLTQESQTKSKPKIIVAPTAKIYGQIYADGWVQLEGNLYGNLSCNRLFVQTPSGLFDNALLNGNIDRGLLPNHFLGATLSNKSIEYGIAKWVK